MYFQVRLEETIKHQREEGEAEQAAQDAATEKTIEHQHEETKAGY